MAQEFYQIESFFLVPFLLFVIVGGVLLSLHTKEVLLLAINSRHSTWSDVFFKYYTHVGDGNTYLVLSAIVLLFVSKYKAIAMVASYALTSLPVQIIKYNIPGQNFRPRAHFWSEVDKLHLTEGVDMLVANSFPSGHTATAFSMFLVFSYFMKNGFLSFTFFIMALLVGCSRMYLAQHFFADVYGGAFIGTLLTILVFYILENVFRLSEKVTLKDGLLG